MISRCETLRPTGHELDDRDSHRHARPAVVAVRTVGEGTAAAKTEPHQFAVDPRVDQVAWSGHLRARQALGQVAAGVRCRRVELQCRQRKVVELRHESIPVEGPGTHPGGGASECINSRKWAANRVRGMGRAPSEAR